MNKFFCFHIQDDDEPRKSRTPEKKESRRILVLKSPPMSSSSNAISISTKPSAERNWFPPCSPAIANVLFFFSCPNLIARWCFSFNLLRAATGIFSKKKRGLSSDRNDRRVSSDTVAVVKRGGVQVKKQRSAVMSSSPVKADKGIRLKTF